MRGRDDHAAANQQAIDALYQARRRAVAECQDGPVPESPRPDEVLGEQDSLRAVNAWDRLNLEYLWAEWPASMLN